MRFFGSFPPPALDMTLASIREFAAVEVLNRITVTGVQKKLSLGIEGAKSQARFTIVALWGRFVLKPPSSTHENLPENEDAVMRLAELSGVPVVPHGLVRLASGELAYICRRVDRTERGEKLAMEDLCQVAERLTEDKYRGSTERAGKLVRRYSVYPGFDAVGFFELVLFCYFTGNADMHLKNYSLLETPQGMRLAPAYDLLSTRLAMPEDNEDSALTINGKKTNLSRADFDSLAGSLLLPEKACKKIYKRYLELLPEYGVHVNRSLLPTKKKVFLLNLIEKRIKAICG